MLNKPSRPPVNLLRLGRRSAFSERKIFVVSIQLTVSDEGLSPRGRLAFCETAPSRLVVKKLCTNSRVDKSSSDFGGEFDTSAT